MVVALYRGLWLLKHLAPLQSEGVRLAEAKRTTWLETRRPLTPNRPMAEDWMAEAAPSFSSHQHRHSVKYPQAQGTMSL